MTLVNIGCGSQTHFYQDQTPGLQYPRAMIRPYRSLSVLNNLRQLPLDCAYQTVWYSPVGYELNRISMFRGLSAYYLVQGIQGSQGGTSLECGVLGVSPCSSWSCRANPLPSSSDQDSVMGHKKNNGANNRTKNLTHKTVQQRDSMSFPHFAVNYSIKTLRE